MGGRDGSSVNRCALVKPVHAIRSKDRPPLSRRRSDRRRIAFSEMRDKLHKRTSRGREPCTDGLLPGYDRCTTGRISGQRGQDR